MPIQRVMPIDFETVLHITNDAETVYVIPSFQRPYAWGEKQITDLRHDMAKAAAANDGTHYLATINLVTLDIKNEEHPLNSFIEDATKLIKPIMGNNNLLRNRANNSVDIFAVIDGQQRLTTLFFLGHLYYKNEPNSTLADRSFLEVHLKGGGVIPRLIQNPKADHDYMMSIVDNIWNGIAIGVPQTQSQKRMLVCYNQIKTWDIQTIGFLASSRFQTVAVELEPSYALVSFMTLNDRGKNLTILEKLKGLLLQFTYDASQAGIAEANGLAIDLQRVFGDLYRTLDACVYVGLFKEGHEDEGLVKLLSCYIRLDQDHNAIDDGPDRAYETYFRYKLLYKMVNKQIVTTTHAEVIALISGWYEHIVEVNEQLLHLINYLDPRDIAKLNTSSIHCGATSTLIDDYRATLLSLQLQPHFLALLLKFRQQHHKELHDRFPIANPVLISLTAIHEFLNKVRANAVAIEPAVPQSLLDYIDGLLKQNIAPPSSASMLQIIERMQVGGWNTGMKAPVTFTNSCKATLGIGNPAQFVSYWINWHGYDNHKGRFINSSLNGYEDTNIRFLLKEYERSKGNNLHFPEFPKTISTDSIELEHIFAQNAGDLNQYGINDSNKSKAVWRIGNTTLLPNKCNESLGNDEPFIKKVHYCNCPGHPNGSGENLGSNIAITKKVGTELDALGTHYPAIRLYIEARSAELALFGLQRFSGGCTIA